MEDRRIPKRRLDLPLVAIEPVRLVGGSSEDLREHRVSKENPVVFDGLQSGPRLTHPDKKVFLPTYR